MKTPTPKPLTINEICEWFKQHFDDVNIISERTIMINHHIYMDYNFLVYEFSSGKKNRYNSLKWCDTKEAALAYIEGMNVD